MTVTNIRGYGPIMANSGTLGRENLDKKIKFSTFGRS